MDEKLVYNVNVRAMDVLAGPDEVKRRLPLTDRAEDTVLRGRHTLERILDRRDHRFMVVVGPCSIHDPIAAMDYARRLKQLADEVLENGAFFYLLLERIRSAQKSVHFETFLILQNPDDVVQECETCVDTPPP